MTAEIDFAELERLSHFDPGGRSLASFRSGGAPLDVGQLAAAAKSLATARSVGIVTGFCVADAQPRAAETDGPPGALYLARALGALNIEVRLISDRFGAPLLRAGCAHWQLSTEMVWELDEHDFERGFQPPSDWTHLISIERAGPSHTHESLLGQARHGGAPIEEFERDVPLEDRNVCHNMRGRRIDDITPPLYRIFEDVRRLGLPTVTIGLADGGNEIGMGSVAWELVREAVGSPVAGRIACRVPTDFLLLAGVSDWAAYALATATCGLAGRTDALGPWTAEDQRLLIAALVQAGALDGICQRSQLTVDGLPLVQYLQVLTDMRRVVGLLA